MLNRLLRISRIVVSVVAFVVLTMALTAPAFALPFVSQWLAHVQLVPALMSYSLFTIVVWLMVTLVFGRIYCSSVCPLGTLQDFAARAVRMRSSTRPYRYVAPRTPFRYIFMAVMALCLMLQNVVAVTILDPYGVYAEICAHLFAVIAGTVPPPAVLLPLPGIILAVVMFVATVVAAVGGGRIVCNTFCPVGSTLGLVSRFSIFHIDIDTDKCLHCRRCEEVCKGRCIDLTDHVVDGSRCVNCFDCINVCPNDAIRYTSRRKQLSVPMMQRIPDTLPGKKPELGESALNSVKSDNSHSK